MNCKIYYEEREGEREREKTTINNFSLSMPRMALIQLRC